MAKALAGTCKQNKGGEVMFDVFEKIMIGLLIFCVIILFICYGIIFYEAAKGNNEFFAHKVYIVNQDYCREAK